MTEYGTFDIRRFISRYGPLANQQTVLDPVCVRYETKLPPDVISFWRENGIGTWLGGKFQFCIPSDLAAVSEILFSGDPEINHAKSHIVGYSAFGDLLIWNESLQTCEVELRYSTMSVGKWDYTEFGVSDTPLATVISRLDSRYTYHIDADRPGYASLFEEAKALIGPLELGQCYGFFPALALGGAEKIKNVRIVDARVHFTMLAEMGPLRIRQMTERDQIEFIRYAGRQ